MGTSWGTRRGGEGVGREVMWRGGREGGDVGRGSGGR